MLRFIKINDFTYLKENHHMPNNRQRVGGSDDTVPRQYEQHADNHMFDKTVANNTRNIKHTKLSFNPECINKAKIYLR